MSNGRFLIDCHRGLEKLACARGKNEDDDDDDYDDDYDDDDTMDDSSFQAIKPAILTRLDQSERWIQLSGWSDELRCLRRGGRGG